MSVGGKMEEKSSEKVSGTLSDLEKLLFSEEYDDLEEDTWLIKVLENDVDEGDSPEEQLDEESSGQEASDEKEDSKEKTDRNSENLFEIQNEIIDALKMEEKSRFSEKEQRKREFRAGMNQEIHKPKVKKKTNKETKKTIAIQINERNKKQTTKNKKALQAPKERKKISVVKKQSLLISKTIKKKQLMTMETSHAKRADLLCFVSETKQKKKLMEL